MKQPALIRSAHLIWASFAMGRMWGEALDDTNEAGDVELTDAWCTCGAPRNHEGACS